MVYSEKFYIGFSDVDTQLEIKNSAILKLFENVCCLQGEAVGDGFRDTPGRWFLTAYHVKVIRRPVYGEWVTARTWSRGMKGVSASREFEIYGEDGELAVVALSNWARMNSAVGKLERMSDEDFAKYESEPERHNFDELWIQKLHAPGDSDLTREYFIDRNLIDPNRHMNNVCYIDLAALMLPDGPESDEFEITYRKAIACGETVILGYSDDGDARYVTMTGKDTGDVHAIVKLCKNDPRG